MRTAKIDIVYVVIGWILTIFSVVMLYRQGVIRSFFHQDDVIELAVVADWQGWKTVGHLNNEHLNIIFWPLLRAEWLWFGTTYPAYLLMNIVFHVIVLSLMFSITYRLTKSFVWASVPVWGMVINSSWFTVVWWITGQMFFLATIFALLSYWVILKIIERPKSKVLVPVLYILSILPGLSWGIGLTWPIWPFLVFGFDYLKKRVNHIGYTLIAAQMTLGIIYLSLVGSNLSVHTDPKTWLSNPPAIINFMIMGLSKTVVGRWLWPGENLRASVVSILIVLVLTLIYRSRRKLLDNHILFGFVVAIGSFVTLAVPRWKFGIEHALANYYAYFPLSFLLIGVAVLLYRMKLTGIKRVLIMSIFLVHIPLSWTGFESWAKPWVVRPQQTRAYFAELNSTHPGSCLENRFIPEYVVPQNIWRIDFLWPIFKKDFDPFCNKKNEP
ncbi:hypothetical protein COY48_00660 [Candidatus Collierbacteria bacterium CG_4_10_14_0_8_um_filter_43_86]|nr:MAG: hypothetical protein COY48_00660 [Candidatus Collierbacteria bacterium CG_4_10_14_0_8_um_filter_43_86]